MFRSDGTMIVLCYVISSSPHNIYSNYWPIYFLTDRSLRCLSIKRIIKHIIEEYYFMIVQGQSHMNK